MRRSILLLAASALLGVAPVAQAHNINGTIFCDDNFSGAIDSGDSTLDGVVVKVTSLTAVPGEMFFDTSGDAVPVSPAVPGFYRVNLFSRTDDYRVELTGVGVPPSASVLIPSSGAYGAPPVAPIHIITGDPILNHADGVNFLLAQCQPPRCGDGRINAPGETCEPPGSPQPSGQLCRDDCTFCGDGHRDSGEACDDGPGNSDSAPDACRTDCTLPHCGDLVIDTGETCEPPGSPQPSGQLCRDDCTFCGDGQRDSGEECDDGNTNDNDGCRNDCTIPFCGDSIVDSPNETCDPPGSPAGASGSICRDDCTVCGDGVVQTGEQCDDGNAVNDDTCRNDCTARDDFECYELEGTSTPILGVSLDDRFGNATVDLVKPKRLCNPANKSNENPTAPSHPDHLLGYIIRQTTPTFVPVRNVTVTNEFGTFVLDVLKPALLLVPSAKSLTGPPGPLADPEVDHFKCYRSRRAKFSGAVQVEDQFGTLTLIVKRPVRLCVPADKNGGGIMRPDDDLMCFKVVPFPAFRGPANPVFLEDQFGPVSYIVNHPREICLLSTIVP